MATANGDDVEERLAEPRRRGARVEDVDGHVWRRGNTRWTCLTPVGTRYYSKKGRRVATVERVGRLHWSALSTMYGPLTVVDLNDR